MNKAKRYVYKLFRDQRGKIVVGQWPNSPMWIWFTSMILAKMTSGVWQSLFSLVSFGALFTWAYLEITGGVNYFRRVLGLVVLVASIYANIP